MIIRSLPGMVVKFQRANGLECEESNHSKNFPTYFDGCPERGKNILLAAKA